MSNYIQHWSGTKIRRLLSSIFQVVTHILRYGIVDIFRSPDLARNYWYRIAKAAVYPATNEPSVTAPECQEKFLIVPKYKLDQIFHEVGSLPVNIIKYHYVYGEMSFQELLTLCQLVRLKRPATIFEFGTYLGKTTLQFAANSDAKVYTLDLPPPGSKEYVAPKIWDAEIDVYPDETGKWFKQTPYQKNICQLFGDTRTFDFTPYYGKMDFIFVDACHHYEFVVRDTKNAFDMLSDGGMIVWHDYVEYAPGVIKALGEFSQTVSLIHLAGTSFVIHEKNLLRIAV